METFDIDTVDAKVGYLDYQLFTGKLDGLNFKSKTVINTINQYSFCLAEKDLKFKQALKQADILLPDGIGMVAAVSWQTNACIRKISGSALHAHLLNDLNQIGGSCFYLGSCTETLQKLQQRLALDYPYVQAGFYSPPFKAAFSREDNEIMLTAINDFRPDVLFVGMTAPKQEIWIAENKNEINVPLICAIGAVFDFYAGTVKRPGKVWIKLGLEWLGRLLNEPKRLWKRYLYYGPVFVFLLVKYKLQGWFILN
ncbi:WecB/TagA/CpsF family glycosyltransferase [Mucilaginibacter arboris]|uniref:WecB/TagA/CpsF family glycosyltransferase n=1 Tax=Mucilaginibacter arboris TaxID=2682090 RepID=A0A7K1T143_9SPHI|nr:WecB/TagA/CpsF family glycosyltransferase [Mucilaginibacter arboris]MVN23274.1 WecB/TagA/CpsF family glycosyltransferase [Mucilaginibacter arboris]